jgi:hypothetical protein
MTAQVFRAEQHSEAGTSIGILSGHNGLDEAERPDKR